MILMQSVMCDGNQNFVLGVQTSTGIAAITDTNPLKIDGGFLATYTTKAVRHAVDTADIRDVSEVDYTSRKSEFLDYLRMPMVDVVLSYSSCEDRFTDPLFASDAERIALRYHAKLPDAQSCSDFVSLCSRKEFPLLRKLCPVTCGCSDPFYGNYFNNIIGGCPVGICQEKAEFRAALNIFCVDPEPETLAAHPGWNRFWDNGLLAFSAWSNYDLEIFYTFRPTINTLGCSTLLLSVEGVNLNTFCDEVPKLFGSSLRAFCPGVCGCKGSDPGCPITCPL